MSDDSRITTPGQIVQPSGPKWRWETQMALKAKGDRSHMLSDAYRDVLAQPLTKDFNQRFVEAIEEGATIAEGIALVLAREVIKNRNIYAATELRKATEGDLSTQRRLNLDMTKFTDDQLQRIAKGEDPLLVAATPGPSSVGVTKERPSIESISVSESQSS